MIVDSETNGSNSDDSDVDSDDERIRWAYLTENIQNYFYILG